MELELHEGWVDAELAAELPGLALQWVRGTVADPRAPAALRHRLSHASDRLLGARAVSLRAEPVPAAYRAFLRTTGVDPDVRRSPVEQAALDRLVDGGYRSTGRVADAVLLGTIETGVALLALDAAGVEAPLGVRPARDGEPVAPGELVVADAGRALAPLLAPAPAPHAPTRATRAVLVAAVQVAGVPDVHVEEALWTVHEALRA